LEVRYEVALSPHVPLRIWPESRTGPKSRHEISRPFFDVRAPGIDEFDWLVIMGGPEIYEEDKYPWLAVREVLGILCQQQDCPRYLFWVVSL